MSLNRVISRWAQDYTVTRTAVSTTTTGKSVAGAETPVSIRAAIVPVTGPTKTLLREGEDVDAHRILYTVTELAPSTDRLTFESCTWEVRRVNAWTHGGTFYECILERV